MFTQIIEKEIREVKFEIENLEILIEGEGVPGWDRGELIDKRYKLKGKLDGLDFALQTYQTNKKEK